MFRAMFCNFYLLWQIATLKHLLLLTLVIRPYKHFFFYQVRIISEPWSKTSGKETKIFRLNIDFRLAHLAWKCFKRVSKWDFSDIFTCELKVTTNFTVSKDDTIFVKSEKKQITNPVAKWLHQKKLRKLTKCSSLFLFFVINLILTDRKGKLSGEVCEQLRSTFFHNFA